MVKTKQPILSAAASGTIGGLLTSSSWRGRPYLKYNTKPRDPRSARQLSIRAMVGFLNINFERMNLEDQAYWRECAAGLHITAQNFYVQRNMIWWTTGRAPSEDVDHLGPDMPGTVTNWSSIVQGRGPIAKLKITLLVDTVGAIWFRSQNEAFSAGWENAIAVHPIYAEEFYEYHDTPLPPGRYYYRCRVFGHYASFGEVTPYRSYVVE